VELEPGAGAVWVWLAVDGLHGDGAWALAVSHVGVDAENEREGDGEDCGEKFGHGWSPWQQ